MNKSKKLLLSLVFLLIFHSAAFAGSLWKITAYCACVKCCGKTDGITASGKKAQYGYVAANWLKFGTRIYIKGLGYFTVQDRGAKSLFGSKRNHIKHLDVYLPTHSKARKFGVKYLEVTVIRNGEPQSENPYRTGRSFVVKEEAVKRMPMPRDLLDSILKEKVAFVEDEVLDRMGFPKK